MDLLDVDGSPAVNSVQISGTGLQTINIQPLLNDRFESETFTGWRLSRDSSSPSGADVEVRSLDHASGPPPVIRIGVMCN